MHYHYVATISPGPGSSFSETWIPLTKYTTEVVAKWVRALAPQNAWGTLVSRGKLLLAKISKLWILSFYIQNNTFLQVRNKNEYQLFMSLYIFWSLNTRLKNHVSIKKLQHSILENWWSTWKDMFDLMFIVNS